jgi:Molecular chaperone GrpE (heat shock protein)
MSNKTMPDNQNESNLDQHNDPTSTPHSSKELELEEEQQELTATAASQADTTPALAEELAKTKDQLLRALADVENIRKRGLREKEETAQYAVTNFARDLLAVADNLERAIQSLETHADETVKALGEGVKITHKELLKVFDKYKVTPIQAVDQPFDPNLHQAMFEIPTDQKPAGTVVQEMQVGYTIASRLLRPSFVGVSKSAETKPEEQNA